MRRKLLVVDDSKLVASWLTWQLEPSGFEVIAAMNPTEAAALIRSAKPSVVVVDLHIPGIPCDDVVASIRLHDPEQKIPIVFYSGQPMSHLQEAVVRYNASGCAQKKRDISELLVVLQACVSPARVARPLPEPTLAGAVMSASPLLFVDDDGPTLRSYQRHFSQQKDVDFVNSPVDALKRLYLAQPSMYVIADIIMPEMSGIDLYHKAVSYDVRWGQRFVFVTGSELLRNTPSLLPASVPVLPKPLTMDRLQRVIERP